MLLYSEQCWPGESSLFLHRAEKKILPAKPLVRWELDKVYALPYTRRYHPIYEAMGGVPAIREVMLFLAAKDGFSYCREMSYMLQKCFILLF